MLKTITWALLQAFFAVSAVADVLPDSHHSEFQEAVGQWLGGDDEYSLNTFANLAREGHSTARILLARIERADRAPSKYFDDLNREERLALFRSPIEYSPLSLSWLETEARKGNNFAALLGRAYGPEIDLQTIRQLHDAGESQATDHLVRIASLYGGPEIHRQLLEDGMALPELHPYVRSYSLPPRKLADGIEALAHVSKSVDGAPSIDTNDPHTRDAVQFMALGIPFGTLDENNPWSTVINDWINRDPAVKPIAQVCINRCPSERGECAITLLGLTGGYYEVIRLDSPLESVISQEEFLSSKRARMIALRRPALNRAEYGGELMSLEDIGARSQCLADLVADERESKAYREGQ